MIPRQYPESCQEPEAERTIHQHSTTGESYSTVIASLARETLPMSSDIAAEHLHYQTGLFYSADVYCRHLSGSKACCLFFATFVTLMLWFSACPFHRIRSFTYHLLLAIIFESSFYMGFCISILFSIRRELILSTSFPGTSS
jgi:hypothetical protein